MWLVAFRCYTNLTPSLPIEMKHMETIGDAIGALAANGFTKLKGNHWLSGQSIILRSSVILPAAAGSLMRRESIIIVMKTPLSFALAFPFLWHIFLFLVFVRVRFV